MNVPLNKSLQAIEQISVSVYRYLLQPANTVCLDYTL